MESIRWILHLGNGAHKKTEVGRQTVFENGKTFRKVAKSVC